MWMITGPWCVEGMSVAANDPDRTQAALTAMLAAKRNDLVSSAVRTFGGAKVLKAISRSASGTTQGDAETVSAWLTGAVVDAEGLAEALSEGYAVDCAFLVLIAQKTYPDCVPNNLGDDPWWTSVSELKGALDDPSQQYLSAYLFARALGYRSRNQAELIEFAFDNLYFPALQSRLSSEARTILESRLPRAWFFDWDYCSRMRDAIVNAFVDRELSPISFTRVTRDDDVFAQLTRAVARTGRGRRFLKRALQSLTNHNEWSRRAEILQDAI